MKDISPLPPSLSISWSIRSPTFINSFQDVYLMVYLFGISGSLSSSSVLLTSPFVLSLSLSNCLRNRMKRY